MRYRSGSAFRQALEARLLEKSRVEGTPLVRLRKMIAFERFLARLMHSQPDRWVLKGGLALQFRFGARARTTKDIDLLLASGGEVTELLRQAASTDLGDWFRFEVGRPREGADFAGIRHPVSSLLDGRVFEGFQVDVGIGDPLLLSPDTLQTPPLLDFAGVKSTRIPCYPVATQLAEKLHAYTRPHHDRQGTRVKDLVDTLLLAELAPVSSSDLRSAIEATFHFRGTHPLPETLPQPPTAWQTAFRRLASEVGMQDTDLSNGFQKARRFLDQVLGGNEPKTWNPYTWQWE